MITDFSGCELTIGSAHSAAAWDRMTRAVLSHGATAATDLATVVEAEPDFALGHATRGLFLLLLGRAELVGPAAEALTLAREAVLRAGATPRERAFVAALGDWVGGQPDHAADRLDVVLGTHPRDALAMKLVHAIRFVLGDARGMRASLDRIAPDWAGHPAEGYLLGCRAFAFEETGDYGLALAAGRHGLDLSPDDAWGLHAVAHVYDMTGRAEDGLDWLSGREAAWAHCNNFRFHVWWHRALMLLDRGRHDEALALYDAEIRAERTDDYRDIANAASLLTRLELESVPVGNRWDELAEISARRAGDGCLLFADLHYLMALIGGGRTADASRLMARLYRDARNSAGPAQARMAEPGLSVAAGLEAFGEGDYTRAYLNLGRARRTMHLAGGSHAQRDVFERITIDAALRAGFVDEAAAMLADRRRLRAGRDDGYGAARSEAVARVRVRHAPFACAPAG